MRNIRKVNKSSYHINEAGLYGLFPDIEYKDKENIKGMKFQATNENACRVLYDGEHVYSNAKFREGDIIEIVPCREITKQAMYSREIRDLVFEVIPDQKWVIPMGYCQHYDIINRQHPIANCDYEWHDDKNCIYIRALCTIQKHSILILNIEK